MSAVQVAGCSGAGKSTVAAVLARRGLVSIDADNDPLLARFVDTAGAVVAEEPTAPDLAWLARHSWAWDPGRLDELIRAAAPATLYVCGGADNQQEVAGRFTQVFLLEIDESTMLSRLDARRDYHDWGHIGDTREYLRRKLPALQDRLRASGAIPIDARQPPDQVVDAILSRTLPVPALAKPGTRPGGLARRFSSMSWRSEPAEADSPGTRSMTSMTRWYQPSRTFPASPHQMQYHQRPAASWQRAVMCTKRTVWSLNRTIAAWYPGSRPAPTPASGGHGAGYGTGAGSGRPRLWLPY
jgi:gluconate kinase